MQSFCNAKSENGQGILEEVEQSWWTDITILPATKTHSEVILKQCSLHLR